MRLCTLKCKTETKERSFSCRPGFPFYLVYRVKIPRKQAVCRHLFPSFFISNFTNNIHLYLAAYTVPVLETTPAAATYWFVPAGAVQFRSRSCILEKTPPCIPTEETTGFFAPAFPCLLTPVICQDTPAFPNPTHKLGYLVCQCIRIHIYCPVYTQAHAETVWRSMYL